MPVPCAISPFQTGLRMHCVWIGLSGGSKPTGSDPPSGFAYRAGGFSHISCPKYLRGGTRTTLASRHLKPSINYVLKLKSLPKTPGYSCVFEPENIKLFQESESKIPPLGIHILPHLEESKLDLNLIDDAPSVDIAPWMLSAPTVRFVLTKFKKDTTNLETYRQIYFRISCLKKFSQMVRKQRKESLRWHTQRSQKTFTCRLPKDSSTYTAELQAFLLALKHIYCSRER